jgi:hypothetical protein
MCTHGTHHVETLTNTFKLKEQGGGVHAPRVLPGRPDWQRAAVPSN